MGDGVDEDMDCSIYQENMAFKWKWWNYEEKSSRETGLESYCKPEGGLTSLREKRKCSSINVNQHTECWNIYSEGQLI